MVCKKEGTKDPVKETGLREEEGNSECLRRLEGVGERKLRRSSLEGNVQPYPWWSGTLSRGKVFGI